MHLPRRLARTLPTLVLTLMLAVPAPAAALSANSFPWLKTVQFSDANNGWVSGGWQRLDGSWRFNALAMRTADGGRTWTPQLNVAGRVPFDALAFNGTRTWVGGTDTNLVWSRGGAGWGTFSLPGGAEPPLAGLGIRDMEFAANGQDGWLVGGRGLDGVWGVIYKTTDGGASWTKLYEGPKYVEEGEDPGPTANARFEAVDMVDGTTQGLAVGNEKSAAEEITGYLVRRTSDGTSWTAEALPGSTIRRLYGVKYLDATHAWVVGEKNNVFFFDGATWVNQKSGSNLTPAFRAVDFVNSTTGWVVGDSGTIMKTTNGGAAWTAQSSGTSYRLHAVDFVDANRGWAVGEGKTILSTTNGGATWTKYAPVERLAGWTRYGTAGDISRSSFTEATSAVLAGGYTFQEALIGAGLAGAVHGPLLVTPPASLHASATAELSRLGVDKVWVVGNAVTNDVVTDLQGRGYTVERVAGSDVYDTAERVAARITQVRGSYPDVAFVARGDSSYYFADALAVSALAAAKGAPVLLTAPSTMPSDVSAALTANHIPNVVISGGTGAVATTVENSIKAVKYDGVNNVTVSRQGGVDRYDTAQLVIRHGVSQGWIGAGTVGVATGYLFPDALAGGAAAGVLGGGVMLTPATALSGHVSSFLTEHEGEVFRLQLYGGSGAVADSVKTAIAGKL